MAGRQRAEAERVWVAPGVDVPLDFGAVLIETGVLADAFVRLLAGVGDLRAPIPGLEWTIEDLAAHVVMACRAFGASAEGRFDGVDAVETAELIRACADVDAAGGPTNLAQQLGQAADNFVHAASARSPSEELPTPWYHVDKRNRLGTMACLILGELTVHGEDLARALRQPWPIEANVARFIVAGVAPAKIPVLIDSSATAGVRVDYELIVDGGPTIGVHIDDGHAVISGHGEGSVDCYIGADPVTMLRYGYGRRRWDELLDAGLIRSWGPTPALGRQFKAYFRDP